MKETAKALGLSEAATAKIEEFYKKTYETMKEKNECPDDKTDEEKKKFMEASIVAIQADVDEAERELVAKVITESYVSADDRDSDEYHHFQMRIPSLMRIRFRVKEQQCQSAATDEMLTRFLVNCRKPFRRRRLNSLPLSNHSQRSQSLI